jgi:hypothetical protein
MKTTRLILAFAAALSLGLAVFANVRTNASTQSTGKVSDELVTAPSGVDSNATGAKVANDCPDCGCLAAQAAAGTIS